MPASRSVNVCARLMSQSKAHTIESDRLEHKPSQLAGRESVAPMWDQSSVQKELRVIWKWIVDRDRGVLL